MVYTQLVARLCGDLNKTSPNKNETCDFGSAFSPRFVSSLSDSYFFEGRFWLDFLTEIPATIEDDENDSTDSRGFLLGRQFQYAKEASTASGTRKKEKKHGGVLAEASQSREEK